MRRNAHVRFGGRPAETHPRKRGQGAAGRPYTRVPTRHGALAAPPSSRGLFSRRIVGWATSSRTGHRPRARRPGAGDPAAQAPRRRRPRGPGPPQRPRIQVTCPSPTPDDSSTRAPVASAGAVGSSYDNAAAEALGKSYKRELVWRDGPWKDRDDPRDRHRPVGELVQPHPTPPRQPRRPLTRRRRTPLPSQPHHHHGTRHGITNPPQNPGRSSGPAHPRHHRPEAGSRRARCRETGTPGSDERPGETTLGNDGTAPPADSYNRLHWVRDVVFDEDRHQLRTANGPQIMAALRNLAISLIRLAHGPRAPIAATTRAMAPRPRRAIDLITRPTT